MMATSPVSSSHVPPPPRTTNNRPSGEKHLTAEERTFRRQQRRERQRSPEEQSLRELARELTWLRRKHPRFGAELMKLRFRVYMQLRSPTKKSEAVMNCFPDREAMFDLD